MTSSDSSAVQPVTRPAQVAGAIAQLAALGVIGVAAFSLVFSLLGVGIALVFVLGIGLLVLVGLVYVLFALGWLETQRVDGLYGFGLPALRPRKSGRPGFGGAMRTIWMQAIDPLTWRAIANLAIATILGWVVVALAGLLVSGAVLAFTPLFAEASAVRLARTGIEVPLAWAVPVGILAVLVAAAGLVGLGVLHGIIARADHGALPRGAARR